MMLSKVIKGEIDDPLSFNRDPQQLPHCPNRRIPTALASVTMKAMAVEQDQRYQSVTKLQAEIEAYQSGFATEAENAGLITQLLLLIKRNKVFFLTATVSMGLIVVLTAVSFTMILDREKKAVILPDSRQTTVLRREERKRNTQTNG